jgi:hypothetical protein
MEYHPGFIQVDRRAAEWTGDKDLAFVWVELPAALRAGDLVGLNWGRGLHESIIAKRDL